MTSRRLYLFDDGRARRWAPFSLTRPIGELTFGCLTLRARAERTFGVKCEGHITRTALVGFDEAGSAPAVTLEHVRPDAVTILLSSRAVPDLAPAAVPDTLTRITIGGATAGWVIPAGGSPPSDLWLRDPSTAPVEGETLALGGHLLAHPWNLVAANSQRIASDIGSLWDVGDTPDGAIIIGDNGVSLGDGAVVEPGVVLDTRGGPIRLQQGVRVEGPARLVGPLFVGEHTTVLGGTMGRSSIGAHCKVRGEVSESVISNFVNKAHDGHIGHAMVGSWVNLGAGTINSDLKNNYGTVKVWTPDGDVDTRLVKIGCFLGDHVKTGIGTLLNTGTVVGAGSNVFGGLMPPVAVPPFSWGSGSELTTFRLEKFMEVTERAMARRGVALSAGVRGVLERAWASTASQRPE
ncbi:MAG: putative sugar nucleotidyl transferase [Gemmatimonadetes bacterium]|jgi:UDP-N-acetylglucosamine diphosphorylase / glucose-1-phosphate thymidylyltransferase / UDP-N-acetylgalactosamine diphosphorylase / glucosamine-1-phosphate N-acetyltransferase / galactosamine-1-phosphate N-acetyltransferase|nr:putative sugar nucleotidyl transferase [Gemmatimonadota bacterium]